MTGENRRRIALFTAAALALVLLASAACLAAAAHHDCAGTDCPVCRMAAACVRTLRLFLCLLCAAGVGRGTARPARPGGTRRFLPEPDSPVTRKVKLSD